MGEVQTNEEATVYVYDKKFIRDNTNPRGYASSSSSKITDTPMSGPLGKKPHPINNGRKIQCKTRRVCQPDLPDRLRVRPQHRCRRTQWKVILRHVRQPHEVGVRAVVPWGDQITRALAGNALEIKYLKQKSFVI